MTAMDGEVLDEIQNAVAEALGRLRVRGAVVVDGGVATFSGDGDTVAVDIGALAQQWRRLSPELRARRAEEIANQLARRRRATSSDAGRSRSVPQWIAAIGIAIAIVIVLYGAYALYTVQRARKAAAERALALREYERERERRAERVCDATRSRVMRGAVIGPTDVEGWVVELALLREAQKGAVIDDPALTTFFAPTGKDGERRLVWPEAGEIAGIAGPDTKVVLSPAEVAGKAGRPYAGATFVLTGRYVVPYFTDSDRIVYVRLATALRDKLDAKYGALYARCAHGSTHHLGAWFAGPGASGAAASLLYFMGTFAEVPHLKSSLLAADAGAFDRSLAFGSIVEATKTLDKARVLALLAPNGGMVAGAGSDIHDVTFPFHDSNRAARASREMARGLGIGTDR